MNHRLHIHKKASSQSAAMPASHLLQSRPVAVPETATLQETPDLQQQQEREKPRGMNLLEIPNLVAGSSPLPVLPSGLGLQAKLTIGEPGDRYEQEADRVAADVVQRIHAPSPQVQREEIESVGDEPMQMSPFVQQWRSAVVQREEIETVGEEQIQMSPLVQHWRNAVVQRQDMQDEEQVRMKPQMSFLQREEMQEINLKSNLPNPQSEGMAASPDLEASIQGARGSGQPLDESIREPMEREFGADFSGVRVHTDGKSDELNQSIQAKAFTTGQDVFFRSGAYDPGSRGGQELLAHELTHVVQQNGVEKQGELLLQRKWITGRGEGEEWDKEIDGITWKRKKGTSQKQNGYLYWANITNIKEAEENFGEFLIYEIEPGWYTLEQLQDFSKSLKNALMPPEEMEKKENFCTEENKGFTDKEYLYKHNSEFMIKIKEICNKEGLGGLCSSWAIDWITKKVFEQAQPQPYKDEEIDEIVKEQKAYIIEKSLDIYCQKRSLKLKEIAEGAIDYGKHKFDNLANIKLKINQGYYLEITPAKAVGGETEGHAIGLYSKQDEILIKDQSLGAIKVTDLERFVNGYAYYMTQMREDVDYKIWKLYEITKINHQ